MWSLLISLLLSSGVHAPVAEKAHDFHVSRLTANYKPEEGRIECTLITFVDDLESVLTMHHQLEDVSSSNTAIASRESLNLTEPKEHPTADSLIASYLIETLRLHSSAEKGASPITFIGKERDDDPYGMFLYFYIEDVDLPEAAAAKLELESTYMLELYEDQQNIVVWQLDGESADYDLLTYNSRTCDFEQ